jgi:hypothetical protein
MLALVAGWLVAGRPAASVSGRMGREARQKLWGPGALAGQPPASTP